MKTIKDIISLKSQPHNIFPDQYSALFLSLENYFISKSDRESAIRSIVNDYDYKARLFIYYQLDVMIEHEKSELFEILSLTMDDTFLAQEYYNEIETNVDQQVIDNIRDQHNS
ncbi:hypothetical protein [Macrococcus carouselicus]|uniref:Uncharacterized protein n=1 Tax=Macrococcus carouselicus TaxID=69969 RepID=A0A9Q8CC16_9STAP|nr:hypothetical protein [Macrococcus carouselicus]TDL95522.1 hypothetical protein ERX40_10085 [Macrococcus carouselicus]